MNGHASASKGPGLGSPCFSLGVGATVYTRRSCVEISVTRCGVRYPGHLARKVNPLYLFLQAMAAVAISGCRGHFRVKYRLQSQFRLSKVFLWNCDECQPMACNSRPSRITMWHPELFRQERFAQPTVYYTIIPLLCYATYLEQGG